MFPLFKDRNDAGHQLGLALADQYSACRDILVLGLARGGMPVAFEVANVLDAPLDVFLVRKLGLPQNEEYAMGAIASGGVTVLDHDVVRMMGISRQALDRVMASERQELTRREECYRPKRSASEIKDRTVILVDDGLATGSSMRAAIAGVKGQQARAIVVAVPVAASESVQSVRKEVDDVVCLAAPESFRAVGLWYQYFPQVSDEQVRSCLARSRA